MGTGPETLHNAVLQDDMHNKLLEYEERETLTLELIGRPALIACARIVEWLTIGIRRHKNCLRSRQPTPPHATRVWGSSRPITYEAESSRQFNISPMWMELMEIDFDI